MPIARRRKETPPKRGAASLGKDASKNAGLCPATRKELFEKSSLTSKTLLQQKTAFFAGKS